MSKSVSLRHSPPSYLSSLSLSLSFTLFRLVSLSWSFSFLYLSLHPRSFSFTLFRLISLFVSLSLSFSLYLRFLSFSCVHFKLCVLSGWLLSHSLSSLASCFFGRRFLLLKSRVCVCFLWRNCCLSLRGFSVPLSPIRCVPVAFPLCGSLD